MRAREWRRMEVMRERSSEERERDRGGGHVISRKYQGGRRGVCVRVRVEEDGGDEREKQRD